MLSIPYNVLKLFWSYIRFDEAAFKSMSEGMASEKSTQVTIGGFSLILAISITAFHPGDNYAFLLMISAIGVIIYFIPAIFFFRIFREKWETHLPLNLAICQSFFSALLSAAVMTVALATQPMSTDLQLLESGSAEKTALYGVVCGSLERDLKHIEIQKRTNARMLQTQEFLDRIRPCRSVWADQPELVKKCDAINREAGLKFPIYYQAVLRDVRERKELNTQRDMANQKFVEKYDNFFMIIAFIFPVLALNIFWFYRWLYKIVRPSKAKGSAIFGILVALSVNVALVTVTIIGFEHRYSVRLDDGYGNIKMGSDFIRKAEVLNQEHENLSRVTFINLTKLCPNVSNQKLW